MLGAKLARRIVPPLLILVGALFALLAVASVWIADARIEREIDATADRVAATLDRLPQPRPEILEALARLVDVELVVDGISTADPEAGRYRVRERTLRRGRPCQVLFAEERIAERRRDVWLPLAVAGTLGLLVALALGLWSARTIAGPVRQLADSVKGFSAGEFDGDVGRRGPGEIGELQDAFVRMVEAIREGEKKLGESERFAALGRLAGGIAHELRNPLTAIRMAVETATGGDEGERAEARGVALGEIDRLDRTLREMLDFVRPRQPVLADVPVRRLLDDVVALPEPQCWHLKVKLVADAPAGLTLRIDQDRVKQALLNLVLNGAQAQPHGGIVRLKGRARVLEVEDEGGGIPEEVLESVLQPFVTTRAAGIGLGLAVVAQVAEEHGAALEFQTGSGGTTFRIVFPP